MNDLIVLSTCRVTEPDLVGARLGPRFGRLDLFSRLTLLAVESLQDCFRDMRRDRVGICLVAPFGSLSTDVSYWQGRHMVGGPSPKLFAYTLPSSAIGEIAIRHQLTGPNLCLVGDDSILVEEAGAMMRRGEADGCVCVSCNVVSPDAAALLQVDPVASACALFLAPDGVGMRLPQDISRDMESLCARVRSDKSTP